MKEFEVGMRVRYNKLAHVGTMMACKGSTALVRFDVPQVSEQNAEENYNTSAYVGYLKNRFGVTVSIDDAHYFEEVEHAHKVLEII